MPAFVRCRAEREIVHIAYVLSAKKELSVAGAVGGSDLT